MAQIIDLSKGMTEVIPKIDVPEGHVSEIYNMTRHEGGAWQAIKQALEIDAESEWAGISFENIVKMYQWFPHYLPKDCIDDFVFIAYYANGDARMIYRKGVGLYVNPSILEFGEQESGSITKKSYRVYGSQIDDTVHINSGSSAFRISLSEFGSYADTLSVDPVLGEIDQTIWVAYSPLGTGANATEIRHRIGESQGYVPVYVTGEAEVGALEIMIPMAGAETAATATVVWATNKLASTIVKYRRSVDSEWIDACDSETDYSIYHSYIITGLAINTQYDVYIQSKTATEEADEILLAAFNTIGTYQLVNINLFALPSLAAVDIASLSVALDASMAEIIAAANDTTTDAEISGTIAAAALSIVSQGVTATITDVVSQG